MSTARSVVLTALANNPGQWTADEIVGFVAKIDPTVHRSSVYRALEAFVPLGVITHVHVGHGTTVYRLADDPRLYAQCRVCGAFVDLPAAALDNVAQALADTYGFRLDPTHVALSGTCADCVGS